jgi:hypothetical protein
MDDKPKQLPKKIRIAIIKFIMSYLEQRVNAVFDNPYKEIDLDKIQPDDKKDRICEMIAEKILTESEYVFDDMENTFQQEIEAYLDQIDQDVLDILVSEDVITDDESEEVFQSYYNKLIDGGIMPPSSPDDFSDLDSFTVDGEVWSTSQSAAEIPDEEVTPIDTEKIWGFEGI